MTSIFTVIVACADPADRARLRAVEDRRAGARDAAGMSRGGAADAGLGALPRDGVRPPAHAAGDRPGARVRRHGARSPSRGFGYWSLVIGTVAGAWAARARLRARSPYPLRLRYDARDAARVLPVLLAAVPGAGRALPQRAGLPAHRHARARPRGRRLRDAREPDLQLHQQGRPDPHVDHVPAVCAVRDRRDLLFESFVKSNRLALLWGIPFGVGVALFAGDLVHFGDRRALAARRCRSSASSGLIAAINHLAYNWDDYFRALGDTKPIAIWAWANLATTLAVTLPLLIWLASRRLRDRDGRQHAGLAGVRVHFLTRLFPGFEMLRHAARAIAPTIPAADAVLIMRLLSMHHQRTSRWRSSRWCRFVVIAVVATAALERSLVREVAGVPAPGGRAAGERCRLTRRSRSPSSRGTRATCCASACARSRARRRRGVGRGQRVDATARPTMVRDEFPWVRLVALGREPRLRAGGEPGRRDARSAPGSRRRTPTSRCGRARCGRCSTAGERDPARGRARAAAACCRRARRSTRSTPSRRCRSRCCSTSGSIAAWATGCAWRASGTPRASATSTGRSARSCSCAASAWEAAGGFDAQQWMYAEDLDLGWRVARAGCSDALRAVGARPASRERSDDAGMGRRAHASAGCAPPTPGCCAAAAASRTRAVTAAINVAGAYARAVLCARPTSACGAACTGARDSRRGTSSKATASGTVARQPAPRVSLLWVGSETVGPERRNSCDVEAPSLEATAGYMYPSSFMRSSISASSSALASGWVSTAIAADGSSAERSAAARGSERRGDSTRAGRRRGRRAPRTCRGARASARRRSPTSAAWS